MKIISLEAENIKKLIAVEIKPEGNLVQITGNNGNGKTSVLDSIWWALSGSSAIQSKPIREGQTQARIRLDLGEIIVTRKFKAKEGGEYTTSITVENAEGVRFPSPQAMIDGLLGQLTFDPLAFSRMDARGQFNALRQFVPDVDFDAIEMENKADYTERAEINRQEKAVRARAEGIPVLKDAPIPLDEKALMDEFEKASKHNADIELRKGNRRKLVLEIEDREAERKRILEQIALLTKQSEDIGRQVIEMRDKIAKAPPLPDPIDTAVIRQNIDASKAATAYFASQEERKKLLAEADKLETESKALTSAMENREAEKRKKIAAAKLPVEGIGFGDGFVMLNGQPFEQASDAERLKASIAIAMALNPKLRVIRVRDGSLLDESSMKVLEEMAAEKDFQVWVERVGSGTVGFELVNGQLKTIEGDA